MKDYKMIDLRKNFINKSYQDELEQIVLAEDFPWFFNANTNYGGPNKVEGDSFQFTNMLYDKRSNYTSNFYNFVRPLVLSIQDSFGVNIEELYRVKFNLLVKIAENNFTHPPHSDMRLPNAMSIIYYVSDSDGETVFYDKLMDEQELPSSQVFSNLNVVDRIKPVKGSAVFFNANRLHASTTPYNNDRRVVLNCLFRV